MSRNDYPIDLTDEQWRIVKKLLPKPAKRGRKRIDRRRIMNAILYVIRTGCQWRALPHNVGDTTYTALCLTLGGNAWWTPSASGAYAAARSAHPGGVTASRVDGSVEFVNDGIDLFVWRAMGTRDGAEAIISSP